MPEGLLSCLSPALQALCLSHEQQTKITSAQSKRSKPSAKAQGASTKDFLAAAGGNAAIAAILARYQQRTQVSTTQSFFADYTPVLRTFLTAEQDAKVNANTPKDSYHSNHTQTAHPDLLAHFFGHNHNLNQTIYHLTALSHLLGTALNRQVIHCTPRDLDDKLFLNTGEIGAKLPQWTLTFDLSACPECAPLTGLIVSRLTCKPVKTERPSPNGPQHAVQGSNSPASQSKGNGTGKGGAGSGKGRAAGGVAGGATVCLASTHTQDPMFCEALGVSISINHGAFTALPQALLLDSESCMSDMLDGAFNYHETATGDSAVSEDAARKAQEDSATREESTDELLSASLKEQADLQPFLQALKYVFYFLTHQDELKSGTLDAINDQMTELNNPEQVLSSLKLWERSLLEARFRQPWQHYVL